MNTKKHTTLRGPVTTFLSFTLGLIIPEAGAVSITGPLQDMAFIITVLVGLGTLIKYWYWFKDRRSKRAGEAPGDEED